VSDAKRPDRRHVFTVDLEEYFQVSLFEGVTSRAEWDSLPSRVERNADRLLELLDRHDTFATFFALGWIADRHPNLIRTIASAGHEIASHGWWHRRVRELGREEFRAELRDSKAILEDLTGGRVLGFRAPSFSIVRGSEWAFDVLLEEGYWYDSSLFPIRRRGYGYPGATPTPHVIERPAGRLLELPLATTRLLRFRAPAAGGAYLRLLPFALICRALSEHERAGESAVIYVHPWELDPDQPRMPLSGLARLRHYHGLENTLGLLERLLEEFRFTSVARRYFSWPSLEADASRRASSAELRRRVGLSLGGA
jgi:polysaccharide deacetylase family protein (PEP-CTERM system associated)